MALIDPYPGHPIIGDPLDPVSVKAKFDALFQGVQAFDGSQILTKSITEAALADSINPRLRSSEMLPNMIVSGCVWSVVSGLNGTMSSGILYVNGYRVVVSSIGTHTFTANKDTYIDIDYLGNVYYQEVANNAVSPSLTANSVRVAIAIAGVALTSFTQGLLTPNATAPAVTSGAGTVTLILADSIGNAIYPNASRTRLLQTRTANQNSGPTTSEVVYNGFQANYLFPVIANRNYEISLNEPNVSGTGSGVSTDNNMKVAAYIGASKVGILGFPYSAKNGTGQSLYGAVPYTATATGAATLSLKFATPALAYGYTFSASTTEPAILMVKEI